MAVERSRGRVLVVDDDVAMGNYLVQGLGGAGYETIAATSGEQALTRVEAESFDVIVTDLRMKGMSGIELCRRVHQRKAELPVIVLTAFGDYTAAVEAVRAGAYDFLAKPMKIDVMELAIARAVEQRSLRREVTRLRQAMPATRAFGGLVGASAAMQKVYELLGRVASSDASVLVTGESGTGKELVARALHSEGPRAAGPFVAINCAALPDNLLEAELFGYEKGAFTDARSARQGLFVEANGGTLFLDEIGELSPTLQAKMLRALQERTVRPLGARKEIPFDVRLVSATNRDLETAIEDKRFREDLYFRIDVVEVRLPPLRARGNDVIALASHFLGVFAKRANKRMTEIAHDAEAKLLAYSWPGNVRELMNAMERAVALATSERVTLEDLPERIVQHEGARQGLSQEGELVTLEEMEKRYILQVLEASGGNKSAAAKTLGLDRSTLWRKLERYRIDAPKSDPNAD